MGTLQIEWEQIASIQTIYSESGINSEILANTGKSISGNQSNNLEEKFQIDYRYFRFNPKSSLELFARSADD